MVDAELTTFRRLHLIIASIGIFLIPQRLRWFFRIVIIFAVFTNTYIARISDQITRQPSLRSLLTAQLSTLILICEIYWPLLLSVYAFDVDGGG